MPLSHRSLTAAATVVAVALVGRPAAAQCRSWNCVPAGTPLRIRTPAGVSRGTFLGMTPDSVRIEMSGPSGRRPGSIARIDVSDVRFRAGSHWRSGAGWGFLGGFGIGVVAAAASAGSLGEVSFGQATTAYLVSGILAGVGIGALAGSAFPRWERLF